LTCALKNARLLPQQFSSESTGDEYIKIFMYVGFLIDTTAMFGQKQTLLLHLFTGINNVLLSMWEDIVHDFLIEPYLLTQWLSTHIYWVLLEEKLPETCSSSMTGLQLALHVRSHCHLQQSLDWTGWVLG